MSEWRLFRGDHNLARNRPATADSQQYGTYAAKANDGDFTTTWFTGKPTPGNWWKVDLVVRFINNVTVRPHCSNGGV